MARFIHDAPMRTDSDFRAWIQRLALPEGARAVIDQVRGSRPARHVRSSAFNVSGRFPSRKMGVTIQFERHRVELPAIYLMEHDPAVLEFYDQPPAIKLTYNGRNGRAQGVVHTADFFVLREDSAGWEEWKREAELVRLAERMPGRYTRQDGGWRCPPGERWAEPLGLHYRLRSDSEIDWVLQRNIHFLEDYLAVDRPPVPAETAQSVQSFVAAKPGITLADTLAGLKGVPADTVLALIADGAIYVDLHAAPLPEATQVHLYRDAEISRAYVLVAHGAIGAIPAVRALDLIGGTRVSWDGRPWMIANVGEQVTTLIDQDNHTVELSAETVELLITQGKLAGLPSNPSLLSTEASRRLAQASPEDLRKANERHQVVAAVLAGHAPSGHTPARTVRDWKRRSRHGEQAYGSGYLGLLPNHGNRGNRHRKLPENSLALMDEIITERYETLKQKRKATVYGELVREGQLRGIVVPSYKTFAAEIRRRPPAEQVARRKGARAAYPHQPFYWELTLTTPRHGDRPFEICHIDHTELDVQLLCESTGALLGRPWLTILTDAYSRRLLALYLTFDPPSYRSAMMVLRACVRRHGRLPRTIVVDGGKEFQSNYFEALLARYECVKKTRPPAKPRFGSVCERMFGTVNTEFVHNLIGNTQIMRNVRQVTKPVDPRQHARWTLDRLYGLICKWSDGVYDVRLHPALGMTPLETFTSGLTMMGERAHRRIPYDEQFMMLTLPTTSKGTAKVDPSLGVKINYLYYWADSFRDPDVAGRQAPVRYEPFNAGIAYAFVSGRWVRCVSQHFAYFEGRSEREIMLATAELRAQKRDHTRSFTISARRLADFIASAEGEEKLLPQRLRDAAGKSIQQGIDDMPLKQRASLSPTWSPEEGTIEGVLAGSGEAGQDGTAPDPIQYEDF